jgi:hypothetical protein
MNSVGGSVYREAEYPIAHSRPHETQISPFGCAIYNRLGLIAKFAEKERAE